MNVIRLDKDEVAAAIVSYLRSIGRIGPNARNVGVTMTGDVTGADMTVAELDANVFYEDALPGE